LILHNFCDFRVFGKFLRKTTIHQIYVESYHHFANASMSEKLSSHKSIPNLGASLWFAFFFLRTA